MAQQDDIAAHDEGAEAPVGCAIYVNYVAGNKLLVRIGLYIDGLVAVLDEHGALIGTKVCDRRGEGDGQSVDRLRVVDRFNRT